jgi:hypothetical protein
MYWANASVNCSCRTHPASSAKACAAAVAVASAAFAALEPLWLLLLLLLLLLPAPPLLSPLQPCAGTGNGFPELCAAKEAKSSPKVKPSAASAVCTLS